MSDAPTLKNGKVLPPRRLPNLARRTREYLTPSEVEEIMKTARRRNRYGHRDATMVLVAYRHGLRVSELCSLRWEQVDLAHGLFHVNRMKKGVPSTHPIRGDELRALRKLRREAPYSPYVFLSERKAPLSPANFRKMLAAVGKASALPFPIHPHMLRHACGFKLGVSSRNGKNRTLSLRGSQQGKDNGARYCARVL